MNSSANWENLESRTAEEVIDLILNERADQRVCFTCSFQAEDIVVLHLLTKTPAGYSRAFPGNRLSLSTDLRISR